MRNISFSITTRQIRERIKFVTRREKWENLKPGTLLQACEKCMGLSRGSHVVKLAVIRVVDVRREPLRRMTDEVAYGMAEAKLEGFPSLTGLGFTLMLRQALGKKTPETVTRIQFEYVD
ncbi:MAG: hypothetical protein PHQ12_03535 [Chthoniobacteraceae bacterium]|nr:hypothetical protein [Chthoniobacteraceae bacterium]